MCPPPKRVVFTDLDGTLLDPVTFSPAEASQALGALNADDIPVVFCSNKTRAEQEVYRKQLGVTGPFIVENGGAVFIPSGYFDFPFEHDRATPDYLVVELGMPYARIREILKKLEMEQGLEIRGFGDMTVSEVAEDTGLSLELARLAKRREYDESLNLPGNAKERGLILAGVRNKGLRVTHGGRYYSVAGPGTDKGLAVQMLIQLLTKRFGKLQTVGIGDSENDLPMLAVVDVPVLVQKPGGRWQRTPLKGVRRVEGVGPVGWNRAVLSLLGR